MNALTGKRYRGVNVLALWAAAEARGFTTGLWGACRQWQEKGAQVRKGEKSSLAVFFKELAVDDPNPETGETERGRRLIAKASYVFNANQVDDFALPDRTRFVGSATSSATERLYSTLLCEFTHWTGIKTRCDREFGKRFCDDAYAMEELVAELGAAFLCADLGIANTPRPDHAAYISHWLTVLKADKKAIFTAASKATQAVDYLDGLRPTIDKTIASDRELEEVA